jgi:hypothetical protein
MTATWKDTVRAATQAPPPGAKERVWRAMQPTAPSRTRVLFVLPVALAAGLALLVLRPQPQTLRGTNDVLSLTDGHADWNPKTNEVTLDHGVLEASVWGAPPLRLHVKGRLIETSGAVLRVRTAGDSVTIEPIRGSLLVDGQLLESSEATRREAGPTTVEALEPRDAPSRRAAQALEAKQWEAADRALDEVARSGALGAEAALLQKGELELRTLSDPKRALSTFAAAAERFPQGNLVQERELSSLEAEFALERFEAAAARATTFLASFPTSERTADVRRVQVRALLKLGRHAEACRFAKGFAEFDGECR